MIISDSNHSGEGEVTSAHGLRVVELGDEFVDLVWSKNSNSLFSQRLWVRYHPLLSLHSTVVSPILPTNERQQRGWADT